MYAKNRINGEWFEFNSVQIEKLIAEIPSETVVFSEAFDKFSNVVQDMRDGSKVIGVRTQKLRGNFTEEERAAKRDAHIAIQKEKKAKKASLL